MHVTRKLDATYHDRDIGLNPPTIHIDYSETQVLIDLITGITNHLITSHWVLSTQYSVLSFQAIVIHGLISPWRLSATKLVLTSNLHTMRPDLLTEYAVRTDSGFIRRNS